MLTFAQRTQASIVGLGLLATAASAVTTSSRLGVLDASENFIVAGQVNNPSATLKPMRVVKYTSAGVIVFSKDYGSLSNTQYTPGQVRIDSSGNVCIAGAATNASSSSGRFLFYVKYSPTGTVLQNKTFAGSSGSAHQPPALALDSSNNAYVAGSYTSSSKKVGALLKITASGSGTLTSTVISTDPSTYLNSIQIDATNRIFLGGTITNSSGLDYALVLKYNTSLAQGWKATDLIGPDAMNKGMALDSLGNPVTVYNRYDSFNTYYQSFAKKHDGATGALTWNCSLLSYGGNDVSSGVIIDATGDVVLAGVDAVDLIPTSIDNYYRLVRLDGSTGTILSNQTFLVGTNVNLRTSALAQNVNGNYWIAGDYVPATLGVPIIDVSLWDTSGAYLGHQQFGPDIFASSLAPSPTASAYPSFYVGGQSHVGTTYYPYLAKGGLTTYWQYDQTTTTP